ncbi:MAG: DUF1844 domain-containing protein [Candidatus Omnitrophica bacterium]|nr:DUF1844 domain-containing protein [Candidatus Omnitrophota bacterium]
MEKKVDESWKEQVEREKRLQAGGEAPRPGPGGPAAPAGRGAEARAGAAESKRRGAPSGAGRGEKAPETDFGFFLSSLSMQAMVALGEIPHPSTNLAAENLEQARYFIDLLGMLQEKTKGNLSQEEESLLEGVLYELRMKYVSRTQGVGS